MSRFLIVFGFVLISFSFLFIFINGEKTIQLISPLVWETSQAGPTPTPTPNPNIKNYSFPALKAREYPGSEINMVKIISQQDTYTTWLITFVTDGKKVSGMLNMPKKSGKLPVIVLIRGYADDYRNITGVGTYKAANYFAENGFITLAPDFLGFGYSDYGSTDILEARFEKPVTVLNLLVSIKNIKNANLDKIFLWGHSNGGQIAISVLEITGRPLPTVLWAPMTLGFPDSVLEFVDEMSDQGKMVKNAISDFLLYHKSEEYSIDTYFGDIKADFQINQGSYDSDVNPKDSKKFADVLKNYGLKVNYNLYPKNDHNLKQSWEQVIGRDLSFYKRFLTKL